jgi:hypothetical protein
MPWELTCTRQHLGEVNIGKALELSRAYDSHGVLTPVQNEGTNSHVTKTMTKIDPHVLIEQVRAVVVVLGRTTGDLLPELPATLLRDLTQLHQGAT